jgi:hypothetical protein
MKNACSRWSFLAVPVLAAFGCSDPVPLPAQGAISLQVGGPSSTCPALAPSETDPGQSVVDGEGLTTVSCSVRGNGPYTFSGSLHATADDAMQDLITISFSNGVVNSDKTTGTVDMRVFTPQLDNTFSNGSTPCAIQVLNQQVKGGSIWADFSCPSLTASLSGPCSSGVAPSVSTFVFENCDGS